MPAGSISRARASLGRGWGMRRAFVAAGMFVSSAGSATAQASATPETVLVTARPPDPVGNAAFSTVLIDADQLQVTPKLDEALRIVPGVILFPDDSSLAAHAAPHSPVTLRSLTTGSGVGRALVTLDGVPQNDPWGQWIVTSSLPVEDLQSVEIVRGAGAGPYGAGALAGVIELSENTAPGGIADIEAGNLEQQRYFFGGNAQTGNISLGASGAYLKSGGWFLVDPDQRGPADAPVGIEATNLSARAAAEILEGALLAIRFGYYDERRALGYLDTASEQKGFTGNATIARPESIGSMGWRAQVWFRRSDLTMNSTTVSAGDASATPSGDVYATPALGWGANAALRGTLPWLDWEVGADTRLYQGQERELFSYSAGAYRSNRFSGGRSLVGGAYAEGASRVDGFLITAGVRFDEWENYDGHVVENSLTTGAVSLDEKFAPSSGAVPTARGGIRKDFANGLYIRTAGYEGFRQPSLNELYHPTRSANGYTAANPALAPERLYGAEFGLGGGNGALTWDVTGFWNRLSGAISPVTLGIGPGFFPGAGFLPAGGRFEERLNVGYVNAPGSEGEARWRINDLLSVRAAYDFTDARVNGGANAPQLTGRRPAELSPLSGSTGFVVFPAARVMLEADAIYQGKRFSDDQNTLVLPAAVTFNARVNWHFVSTASIYLAVDNIGNTRVVDSERGDGVFIYDQPRAVRAGITATFGP